MNLNQNQFDLEDAQRGRNAYVLCMVLLLAFFSVTLVYGYLAIQLLEWQLYVLTGLMFVITAASGIGIRMIRRNQIDAGANVAIFSILLIMPMTSVLIKGLGIYLGVAELIGISLAITLAKKKSKTSINILNLVSSGLTAFIDIVGAPYQLSVPIVQTVVPAIVGLGLLVFMGLLVREFKNFNLQTKFSIGILATGGVTLAVLAVFAFNRAGGLVDILYGRFETTVNLLAEEQLYNTVSEEAGQANKEFDATVLQVQNLADQIELLLGQKDTLGEGVYRNASEELIRLSNGQYTNTLNAPSSIFVPSHATMNDAVLQEINALTHLDFSAPLVLQGNSQVKAVYYTNPNGVVMYYPNVWFSANVPHDYDGTKQPSYRIAAPLFNPQKQARWSFPRQDPAGVGMIVSVSVPVYFNEQFSGVVTADFRLNSVANNISDIKVGQTGYAFLIDHDGHIIAMPPQGYELFEIEPEILEANQEPTLTIFDGDIDFGLQQITQRMVVGGDGIVSTETSGSDVFIAYAPVADQNFSLGLIVPSEELTRPVEITRQEVATQIQSAVQSAIVILIVTFIVSIIVSVGLGRLIASPIRRLTQTANQILEGNLGAQALIATRDETGTLAQAFNAMTKRLRETLTGLEKTIAERTAELTKANQANQRKATQFQSIAQVARTVSSTLDFDILLTRITTAVSREFGFYHVGVFLLDTAGEYAVLSAANSEGGQMLLIRGHRLKVGEKGLVGFVSSTGRPRIALDTGTDAVFFNNPDLPDTRSEIALPLRAGDTVIGVLDVQSREPNAFSQDDVAILSTLTDQVSIAIQNARQNEETRKALSEADALSRQFVQSGWSQFTKKQNLLGVRHTGAKSTILYAKKSKGKDDTLQSAGQLKPRGRGAVLSLPIKLRGQVIGSVDVRAPDNRRWDQDEMDIVTAIIERAAIAMENARLLSESQKRAAKERTIGEISAKISAQSEVDELIKTAALELNRNLPGLEIAIQFNKEQETGNA